MNNYCTNCGEKLHKDDLVCKKCNTPVVEIPKEYLALQKEKNKKLIRKIILIIVGVISIIFIIIGLIKFFKANKMKKDLVIPYIEENYSVDDYKIIYSNSGKCIVSGECRDSQVRGCALSGCEEYEYLEDEKCTAYYFKFTDAVRDKTTIITVVDRKDTQYVVEGENIYGRRRVNYGNKYDDTASYFPYKSEPISIERPSVIKLASKSPEIQNTMEGTPLYSSNNLKMKIKLNKERYEIGKYQVSIFYLNKNLVEIGKCDVDISFSHGKQFDEYECDIKESDLYNNTFNNIKYYQYEIKSSYTGGDASE